MEQDPSTELPPQRASAQPPPIPQLREHPVSPPPIRPVQPLGSLPIKQPVPRRAYPKPPSILRHIALLCARPDQWAQAARYPMYVTLIPVIVTILLASLFLSINSATSSLQFIRNFAQTYDQRFTPLTFSKGVLTGQATADKHFPQFNLKMPGPFQPMTVKFDPAIQATPSATDSPTVVFSNRAVYSPGLTLTYEDLNTLLMATLAPPTDPFIINSAGIVNYLHARKLPLLIFIGFIALIHTLVRNLLWSLLTAFLVTPFVQLAGQRLAIPYRVAWRIAFSINVPQMILGACLEIVDMPL